MEVLDKTKDMTGEEIRTFLEKKGVPLSTFKYWRQCVRDGYLPNRVKGSGRPPSQFRKMVREEIEKHLEKHHQ